MTMLLEPTRMVVMVLATAMAAGRAKKRAPQRMQDAEKPWLCVC